MQLERWTSPAGKRRSLSILDAAESGRYRRAVAIALPRPPPASYGLTHPAGRRWYDERRAYRTAIRSAVAAADVAIVSDVAECYPSIGSIAIRLASRRAAGDPEPLLAFLASAHDAGIEGLPIGPAASAAVADAVLAIADARAAAAGLVPIRWVDDVVFAGSRDQVARAERAWRAALHELGLRDHEGKRRRVGAPPAPSLARACGRAIMRSS